MLPIMLFVSLFLGLTGLLAFLWAIKKNQFSDPEKSRYIALDDDEVEKFHEKDIKKSTGKDS